MGTAYFACDQYCCAHETGVYHPDQPDRLPAIQQGLRLLKLWDKLDHQPAPQAGRTQLTRTHSADLLEHLEACQPWDGLHYLDNDTPLGPDTLTAARHAAGAGIAAVDHVMQGYCRNAFCAVRPPGHHAEIGRAMGFCFYNNIAVAAAHALHAHGLERVAVLDFDVHHGNGTEDICRHDPRILFCSSYQNPFFPYTDNRSLPGRLIKTPLRAGIGSAVFRRAIERDWLPALHAQKPQLILISAGFDAHRTDPMADLLLEAEDYAWITEHIAAIAAQYAGGRMVSMLEGGYALEGLAASAALHIQTLYQHGQA